MLARRTAAVFAVITVALSFALSSAAEAQEPRLASDTIVLDLDAARRIALESSPLIQAALADVQGARGSRRQAGTYRYNPELLLKVSSLIDPGDAGSFEGLLTQQFEWAGQWGLRKAAADYGIAVAQGSALDVVRTTFHAIDVAYYRASTAQHRLEVSEQSLELSRRLLEAVRIQLREGEVSALDVNLAEIENGRAIAAERSARRDVTLAVLDLTRLLGLVPGQPVRISGEEPTGPDPASLSLDSLVQAATEQRPDLQASDAEVARATANRRLVAREAFPNLSVSAVAERGALHEGVQWGLRFGLPIPLFNRNGGLSDLGEAEQARAEAEREAVEIQMRTEVTSSLEAYSSAWEELEAFELHVLRPARSNQSLLETAYVAGRLDLPTTLLLRTQLLEAELGYWDAWLAERVAFSALLAAVGDLSSEPLPEF